MLWRMQRTAHMHGTPLHVSGTPLRVLVPQPELMHAQLRHAALFLWQRHAQKEMVMGGWAVTLHVAQAALESWDVRGPGGCPQRCSSIRPLVSPIAVTAYSQHTLSVEVARLLPSKSHFTVLGAHSSHAAPFSARDAPARAARVQCTAARPATEKLVIQPAGHTATRGWTHSMAYKQDPTHIA